MSDTKNKNYAVLSYDETTGGSYPLEHYSVWWFETEEKAKNFALSGKGQKTIVKVVAEAMQETKINIREIA